MGFVKKLEIFFLNNQNNPKFRQILTLKPKIWTILYFLNWKFDYRTQFFYLKNQMLKNFWKKTGNFLPEQPKEPEIWTHFDPKFTMSNFFQRHKKIALFISRKSKLK